MKDLDFNYKKMLTYCLMVLCSFAVACDDDDDDDDILPDTEIDFDDIDLTGENEVPMVTTSGVGELDASYNDATNILSYTYSWTLGNPDDEVTGAHFHGPASTTETAPPVITVTPSTTDDTGTYSGTTRALTQDEEDDLKAGLWYLNIHSTTNPDGELRGQLVD